MYYLWIYSPSEDNEYFFTRIGKKISESHLATYNIYLYVFITDLCLIFFPSYVYVAY